MTSGYIEVFFISIGWMPFLAPNLDNNADPLFVFQATLDFYLHHVEVQGGAGGGGEHHMQSVHPNRPRLCNLCQGSHYNRDELPC